MPKPVMGAMLVFTISFMIMSGLQILTSRMLDTRKTLIAGLSIIFGLSADILPELYENVHPWISPVFTSSLSLGTTMAVVLNLLLRIGIKRHANLVVESAGHASNALFDFFEKQGGIWGARKEVVYKVITADIELSDSIYGLGLTSGKIEFRTDYSEESIELTATYEGAPIELDAVRPTREELIADERASLNLARYLVRRSADQVEISSKDNYTQVKMCFVH
jgi:NCS2 family nucleobase:cation symporter-2